MAPRHRHADASKLLRWFLDIAALTPRRCRACAPETPRWRLVITGIVSLRLGIACTTRTRTRQCSFF
jgi:hypothetical protein